ncbi:MAG: hypothetical protein ACOCRO_01420, partial [Halanaerobiales bacterium]
NSKKKELLLYIEDIINEMDEKAIDGLNKISKEDCITLLESHLIKDKLDMNNDSIRINLLKILLTY